MSRCLTGRWRPVGSQGDLRPRRSQDRGALLENALEWRSQREEKQVSGLQLTHSLHQPCPLPSATPGRPSAGEAQHHII